MRGDRRAVKVVSKVDPVGGSGSWRVLARAFEIESDATGTRPHVSATGLCGPAVAARYPRLGLVAGSCFFHTTL